MKVCKEFEIVRSNLMSKVPAPHPLWTNAYWYYSRKNNVPLFKQHWNRKGDKLIFLLLCMKLGHGV